MHYLCNRKTAKVEQKVGAIAQLVEQRTENPCVPGSIPGGTTENHSQIVVKQRFGIFLLSVKPNFGNILTTSAIFLPFEIPVGPFCKMA